MSLNGHSSDSASGTVPSASLLHTLANSVPGVLYQFIAQSDGTYRISFVNESAKDILGPFTGSADIIDQFAARIPETHRDAFWTSVEAAVREAAPWEFETPYQHPETGVRWLRATSSPHVRGDAIVFSGLVLDVTERVRSQRRFRQFTENINDLISVHRSDGTFLYASPAARPLTGYSPESLVGRNLFDFVHPADRARVDAQRVRVVDGAERIRFEYRLLRANGRPVWVEVTGRIIHSASGQRQLLAVTRSTHERKRAEEKLQRSHAALTVERERLEMALRGGDLGLWDCDHNREVTVINDRWASMLGYAREEVEPAFEMFPKLVHPDDYARYHERFSKLRPGGTECIEAELRMRAANGSWRWIFSSGCVMEWNDDGTPHRVVGTHRDITEKKRQASIEDRLGRLLEGSASEIYIANAETYRLVQVNRGAREQLGYSDAALTDMTLLDLMACSAEQFATIVAPLQSGARDLVTFETEHQSADGSTYPVEIRLQLSANETPPVLIAIATDITARKTYEKGLIEARKRAEEASRLKSALVASVSHDVRSPLTGIVGYAQIMRATAEDDEQRRIASVIEEGSERLLETLNSVLRLSKLDSGAEQPDPEDIDGANVLRNVAQDHRLRAQQASIRLDVEAPAPCTMHTDPVMVRRILSNLLSNALKFTEAGGRVCLRAASTGEGRVQFDVDDTGPGMSEAFQQRMFGAFEREDEADDKGDGYGLGLAIVKRLVDLLEGSIHVDSTQGEGTRFRILLPSLSSDAPPS